jgi:hypothetical protein
MKKTMFVGIFAGMVVAIYLFGVGREVFAQVMINEVLPNPTYTNDNSEWLELFNYSDDDVDLSSWSLAGESFPENTLIPSQGYLVIARDPAALLEEFGVVPGVVNLNVRLVNSGTTVELAHEASLIDTFVYPSTAGAHSWERRGPNCSEVEPGQPHSLGVENPARAPICFLAEPPAPPAAGTPPALPNLVISEFLPDAEGSDIGNEWLEILNAGAEEVVINGELIARSGSSSVPVPDGTIPPGGYLVVTFAQALLRNCNQPDDCQDDISIHWNGSELDTIVYNDSAAGQSWSKDSSGNWHMDWKVTPGRQNQPFPIPIVNAEMPPVAAPVPTSEHQTGQTLGTQSDEAQAAQPQYKLPKLTPVKAEMAEPVYSMPLPPVWWVYWVALAAQILLGGWMVRSPAKAVLVKYSSWWWGN